MGASIELGDLVGAGAVERHHLAVAEAGHQHVGVARPHPPDHGVEALPGRELVAPQRLEHAGSLRMRSAYAVRPGARPG